MSDSPHGRRRRGGNHDVLTYRSRFGLLTLAAMIACMMVATTACDAPVDQYIALGDSYASGPFIQDLVSQPRACLRSSRNYPSLVREHLIDKQIPLSSLFDVSCSGASIADLSTPQSTSDGNNIAQFDVVGSRAKIVTLTIGANDIGFFGFMVSCIDSPIPGGCLPYYVTGTDDLLRDRIDATAPALGATLDEIHSKAPAALVLVVGYPTILPADGNCPSLSADPDDIRYLSSVFTDLNAMLRTQAEGHGALYVDTATTSVGHDMCAGTDAWINLPNAPVVGVFNGLENHPNAAGMANIAAQVNTAIDAVFDK